MSPLRSFARRAGAAVARHPIAFASTCTTFKAVTCDQITQRFVEQCEHPNRSRTAAFGAFGFIYCGVIQYHVYSILYPWLAARLRLQRPLEAAFALTLDFAINIPFIYYPLFYVVQDFVQSCNQSMKLDFAVALGSWQNNFREDMLACAAFWIPCNGINFLFMPYHLRVPFAAGVGFGWLVILSYMRGGEKGDTAGKGSG